MILIIDDEEPVCRMLADLLELLGYESQACHSGGEGAGYYAANHTYIDICIIDLRLPDGDGRDVLARMREMNPDAKAILISGYNPSEEQDESIRIDGCRFLQKPFMLSALKDALDGLSSRECPVG